VFSNGPFSSHIKLKHSLYNKIILPISFQSLYLYFKKDINFQLIPTSLSGILFFLSFFTVHAEFSHFPLSSSL
jgi:hypothetical protein